MPFFTTAIAFLGLAALPALVAIYYLHHKARRQVVSSLLLWVDPREAPGSGRRVERLRTPLLFWLELFALLLLVLAAAGPLLPATVRSRPLVIVLDDSYSMLAGNSDSPRHRAAAALQEELSVAPRSSVKLILAGSRPQILGEGGKHSAEIDALLKSWTCQAPSARLDEAILLALEVGGDLASVLVLTDHAPDPPPSNRRLRWWAFGSPRDNWAFVNANRTAGPRGDRILLEVANLATGPRSTTLRVETGEPVRELHRSEIRLAPFESHRLVIEVPEDLAGGQIVRAYLDDDDLAFDNTVSLVPAERKIVRYDIKLSDKKIRKLVERAMQASGAATPSEDRPHLLFHDADLKAASDEGWGIRMMAEADAEAYLGPFVLDRSHPLTDGLSLSGVIWAAGKNQVSGAPVVMAGNIPLLTDTESAGGRHDLKLRLRPDISTLPESPAWPTLMWNLVRWRASALPGLDQPNIHLGQEATWTLSSASDAIEVTRPDGKSANVPAREAGGSPS